MQHRKAACGCHPGIPQEKDKALLKTGQAPRGRGEDAVEVKERKASPKEKVKAKGKEKERARARARPRRCRAWFSGTRVHVMIPIVRLITWPRMTWKRHGPRAWKTM